MISVRFEYADTVFDGLQLDEDFRTEFIDKNFTTGDNNISYSLTPLVIFYEKLAQNISDEEAKQLLHEIYQSLHNAGCSFINVEQ
jgi:hypothetical protein